MSPRFQRAALRSVLACALAIGCGAARGAERDEPEIDPLDSVSGEELYRRGVLLARAGDFVRSEQYLAASMERGMPEARVLPTLLAVCIEASRLAAALTYAEPFLAQHPSEWALRMLVASIQMGLGRYEVARAELERVLADAPEEPPEAHYFLGVLHRDELADPEVAATHFERYLALAPEGGHVDEARAALNPIEVAPAAAPEQASEEGPREAEPEAPTDPAPRLPIRMDARDEPEESTP